MDIEKCIENALSEKSKLNADVLNIDGMSSRFNRHLLNNLGAEFGSLNYLEIGVHKGSTFVSSLFGNNVNHAWAIDDWSQFDDQTPLFIKNCDDFKIPAIFFNVDCFMVDVKAIRDINFYLYDGNHYADKTAKGLTYFYDSVADEFLYVVDDYDWDEVQQGTELGIKQCGFKVKYQNHLRSDIPNNPDGWWNGLGIFLLSK